jgi:glycine dehydrogenase subunit 2
MKTATLQKTEENLMNNMNTTSNSGQLSLLDLLEQQIDGSRALKFEEALLFDQSEEGSYGVDLPEIPEFELKTGQAERQQVGLPQISEPTVVRHFTRLSQQNYSIDTGFLPLGSCTMKHNPRLNEKLARLSGFANLHPLQPDESVQGALKLMWELQHWLGELSGLPAVTLNPAAGAHGELAGVMVIHKAHIAAGNAHKKIMLIPDSAHGTNPATAAACGFEIKSIPTAKNGQVDLDALKALVAESGDNLAGIMLTNPNTCGIFESNIQIIADEIHKAGGYFYCDGANYNAIVGKVKPGELGVDVMHFNLHKTFSTPHGGGGPGCGPIAVTKALEPFLPVPKVVKNGGLFKLEKENATSIGRLKAFQGQFGMFVRALTYMYSHGADGLKRVAEDAVLNANYVFAGVKNDYFVPFDGYCMHEFLITDKLQKEHGISTMEIAKTLIEYGFHPMTVYFPLVVQGAMLVEPTETETKQTLDKFIATMRIIAEKTRLSATDDKYKQELLNNPVSAPRKRLDEVKAAKEPVLKWVKK